MRRLRCHYVEDKSQRKSLRLLANQPGRTVELEVAGSTPVTHPILRSCNSRGAVLIACLRVSCRSECSHFPTSVFANDAKALGKQPARFRNREVCC